MRFSLDGTMLVAGDWNGTIWVWDLKTGKLKSKTDLDPFAMIDDVLFAPDGKSLIVAVIIRDGDMPAFLSLRRWPAVEEELARLDTLKLGGNPGGSVARLAACKNADQVAVLNSYRSIAVVKFPSGKLLRQYSNDRINEIAWSPDGRWLAGSTDSEVVVLDAANLTEVTTVELECTAGIAFSPDNRLLAMCSGRTGAVWEIDRLLQRPKLS